MDPGRRRFLRSAVGAAAILGGWPGLAVAADPPARQVRVLRKPIQLKPGERLENQLIRLAPDFQWTTAYAVIFGQGTPGVVLRNLRIEGSPTWQARWRHPGDPPVPLAGIPGPLSAIKLQKAPRALIENVEVDGFPKFGIFGFGLDDAIIRDVEIRHCFHALKVAHYQPSPRLTVERVKVRDTWGPGPGHWPGLGGDPSAQRPGGFSGGDGIVLDSVRSGVLRDCDVRGEHFGSYKLVNPMEFQVSGLTGMNLMVQGTADLDWKIHKQAAQGISIQDCVFDKSLGFGRLQAAGNCLQMSWHVHGLSIERCQLKGAGYGGHGLELAVDVEANVVDCTFQGFNGKRHAMKACAAYAAKGCTLNADFEQRNQFIDQQCKVVRDEA